MVLKIVNIVRLMLAILSCELSAIIDIFCSKNIHSYALN